MSLLDVEAIEAQGIHLPVGEKAKYLRDQLGQEMAAYVCGLKYAPTIAEWIRDPERTPTDKALRRLGTAYVAVRLVSEAFGQQTAKMWLFGANTRLGDAPAYVLHHAETLDDLRMVVPVAKTFAGNAG
jgi:hypothetical protein